MCDDESLQRRIETHMETAEGYIRQGQRHRAYMEIEKASLALEAAGKQDQLAQLWGHAAAGFTAAEAPLQAGHCHIHLARLEATASRQEAARDSYLAAANAFAAVRNKTRDTWTTLTTALEQAIELTLALDEPAMAIDLLVKCAAIHHRETGYTFDAINCLERAQQLLQEVPNHPLADDVTERLQALINESSH